jgi:hypothetical protein
MTDSINPWADSPEEQDAVTKSGPEGRSAIVRLKLPEGDTRVRIRGHYFHFYEHWFNKIKRTANCPGKDCPVCHHPDKQKYLDQARALREGGKEEEARDLFRKTFSTYDPRLKYAVNVIDRTDGQMKIWQFSRTLKEDIMKFAEINGDPNGYDIVISRKGLKRDDTEYRITPTMAVVPLTAEEQALKLFTLATIFKATPVDKINSYLAGRVPPPRAAAPAAGQAPSPFQQDKETQLPTTPMPPNPGGFDLPDLDDIPF